jgi:hypothetical protein
MRRGMVLGLLLALGGLAVVKAQPPADAPKVIDVEKVKDNLYVLRGNGGGGNTAVFLTANGVVVVDAKNPGWGTPILNKIKELTPKPVTMLINTHTHGDHVSGNVEFPATIDFVAQENTKVNMEKMPIFKEHNGVGMAKRTFKDRMTLGKGADQIDLYYFGRGHTNGGQVGAAHRRGQRRQHDGDLRHADEGVQRDQERRHDHQWPHPGADDVGGPEGVRRLQQGAGGLDAGGAEGRQDAGTSGRRVEAAGEVQRLFFDGQRSHGRHDRAGSGAPE